MIDQVIEYLFRREDKRLIELGADIVNKHNAADPRNPRYAQAVLYRGISIPVEMSYGNIQKLHELVYPEAASYLQELKTVDRKKLYCTRFLQSAANRAASFEELEIILPTGLLQEAGVDHYYNPEGMTLNQQQVDDFIAQQQKLYQVLVLQAVRAGVASK